jgi:hypothetical protein
MIERLAGQAGTVAVGATSHLPLSGQNVENSFTPEGWTSPSPDQNAVGGLRGSAGRYVDAIGARITAGRALTDDDTAQSQLVAMVNEQFARRYWAGQNALGRRLKLGPPDSEDPWRVVVGVYAETHGSAAGDETGSHAPVRAGRRRVGDAVDARPFRRDPDARRSLELRAGRTRRRSIG